MPFYTYTCEDGHEFKELVKMSERDNEQQCPECSSPAKRNEISQVAPAQYKGDWFKTTGKY